MGVGRGLLGIWKGRGRSRIQGRLVKRVVGIEYRVLIVNRCLNKIEMDFKKNVILPQLNMRNKVLSQRKEYMRSINKSEMMRHEK